MIRHPRRRRERGSVMVIVAIVLPVLMMFASFAIDVGHWYDYSRNLQNRADAAALAAGDQLAICLGSPSATAEAGIGETAQQYSGPPAGTPPDTLANLPYGSSLMTGNQPYYNVPNLTAAKGPDFHLLLNHTEYWPNQTNDANGYGDMGSYCSATDPTDPSVCPAADNPTGCPIVDVRETQANVPMFINMFGLHPNISAHARVQLELMTGGNVSPIAVGDAGDSGCMVARVVDETNQNAGPNSDGVLVEQALSYDSTTKLWSGGLPALTIPKTNGKPDQLGVQAVIPDDCGNPYGSGQVWDAPTNGPNAGYGIVFINTYSTLSPPVSAPTRGSAWLEQTGCSTGATNDPYFYYFTSGTCSVRLHAQVDFPATGGPYVLKYSTDGGTTWSNMGADTPATDGAGNTLWVSPAVPVAAATGRTGFVLGYTANGGKVTAFGGGNPIQATFAAFDDGSGTDDSGPVVQAHVGCTSGCPDIGGQPTTGATSGVDSLPGDSTAQLTVTFKLLGLSESGPNDKPVILRSSITTNKRTGVIDCGAGGDATGFQWVMENGGCGVATISKTSNTLTSSLTDYTGSLTAYSGSGQWPYCIVLPSNPISCGEPATGQMAGPIHDAIATLICGDVKCQTTQPGKACDYWGAYKAGTGPLPNGVNDPGDPRAISMMITTPQDLALPPNDPRWIRAVGFATFYVTGWIGDPYDPGQAGSTSIPGPCPPNTNTDESYPNEGKLPNTAVWGHFIQYVYFGQSSSGETCPKDTINNCTTALTR